MLAINKAHNNVNKKGNIVNFKFVVARTGKDNLFVSSFHAFGNKPSPDSDE